MIEPHKLHQLKGGQRRRKLALCFGSLERDIAGIAEKGHEYTFSALSREDYTKQLLAIVINDPQLPHKQKGTRRLTKQNPLTKGEPVIQQKHLLNIIGTFPAE